MPDGRGLLPCRAAKGPDGVNACEYKLESGAGDRRAGETDCLKMGLMNREGRILKARSGLPCKAMPANILPPEGAAGGRGISHKKTLRAV